jgi:hypothetical protein
MKLLNFLFINVPYIKVNISTIDDDHVLIRTQNGKEIRNTTAIVFSESQIQKIEEIKLKIAESSISS